MSSNNASSIDNTTNTTDTLLYQQGHLLNEIFTLINGTYYSIATPAGKISYKFIEFPRKIDAAQLNMYNITNVTRVEAEVIIENGTKLEDKYALSNHTHELNSLSGVLSPNKGGTGLTNCPEGTVLKWSGAGWTCGTVQVGISSCSACDSRFVNAAGDTISGNLNMRDKNILDANKVQANTLEDPEDSLLYVNDNLQASGYVKGSKLCIRNDCRTSWPSGGIEDIEMVAAGKTYRSGHCNDDRTLTLSCPDGYYIDSILVGSACDNCGGAWSCTCYPVNWANAKGSAALNLHRAAPECKYKVSCTVKGVDMSWSYYGHACAVLAQAICVKNSAAIPCYEDNDGDGHYAIKPTYYSLSGNCDPGDSKTPGDDCDDSNPFIYKNSPWGTLSKDGKDNDCDGIVDERGAGYIKLEGKSGNSCNQVCGEKGFSCVSVGNDMYASNGKVEKIKSSWFGIYCRFESGGTCDTVGSCNYPVSTCRCPPTYCKCSGTVYH